MEQLALIPTVIAVALEVVDHLAFEVDLVQMGAAVVQTVGPTTVGLYSLVSLSSVAWYPE